MADQIALGFEQASLAGDALGYKLGVPLDAFRNTSGRRLLDSALATAILGPKSPVVFFVADTEGSWTFVNDVWESTTQTPKSYALGLGWQHQIVESSRERVSAAWAEAVLARRELEIEFEVAIQAGVTHSVRLRSSALNQDENFQGFVGTLEDVSEARNAMAAVEHERSQFDWFFNAIPQIVWRAGEEGQFLDCNEQLLRYTGLSVGELKSHGMMHTVHLDDVEPANEKIRFVMQTGEATELKLRIRRFDGEYRWHQINFVPKPLDGHDDSTNPSRILLTVGKDIHGFEVALGQLAESQKLLSAVATASPDIIYLYDIKNGGNIWANRSTFSMLGYTVEEIQAFGENLFGSLVHPEDLQRVFDAQGDVAILADGAILTTDYRMRHRDGHYVWLSSRDMVFERDADGTPIVTLGVAQDVTERKESELAKAKHAQVLENALEGVAILNAGGQYVYINEAGGQIMCRQPLSMIGLDWVETIYSHDQGALKGALNDASINDRGGADVRVMRPDGTLVHVNILAVAIREDQDEVTGYYMFIRDIESQKSYENQIEQQIQELAEIRVELELRQVELEWANEALKKVADTDGLTQLANHRSFQSRLEAKLLRGIPVAVLLLDVDKFKTYNDSFGHPAGDNLLMKLSRILEEQIQDRGFAARYGGEEFVLVMPDATIDLAMELAESVRAKIESTEWPNRAVTVSIGCAITGENRDRAVLIQQADTALYKAKNGGRNQVVLFTA